MSSFHLFLATLALGLSSLAGAGTPAAQLAPEPFALLISSANETAVPSAFASIRGAVWKTPDGAQYVVLRSAETAIPVHANASITVPAAALSARAAWKPGQALSPTGTTATQLAPLLDYLATRNDIPRETSQLAVLALLENIGFADWQKYLASVPRPEVAPAVATAEALDALTILRAIAPAGTFALASDAALKLRALHDPLLRGQARQLFGFVVPGDVSPGGVPPDLGQLLHTKPGDNCPICRMREQMQRGGDIP